MFRCIFTGQIVKSSCESAITVRVANIGFEESSRKRRDKNIKNMIYISVVVAVDKFVVGKTERVLFLLRLIYYHC